MKPLNLRERGGVHLEGDAGNASERFMDIQYLFGNRFRVTDYQSAGGAAQGVKLGAA